MATNGCVGCDGSTCLLDEPDRSGPDWSSTKIVPGRSAIDRGWVDPSALLVEDESTIRPHPISIAPIGCFGHRSCLH